MDIKNIKCTQCGASDFEFEKNERIRCNYCQSLFVRKKKSKNSGVIIKKGGKVTFGSTANVIIRGGLTIEDGAEVQIDGKITLIEKGSDEDIKKARARLKS